MRILVTGSNGFVGSHVVKQLLDEGYEVLASSRSPDLSAFGIYGNYQFHQMDITDPAAIHDIFEQWKPEAIIHCAAISKPDECETNQAKAYLINVESTVQLLLYAADQQCFFVHLSTDFIFNGSAGMYQEDAIPDPINYYGKTKVAAEEVVKEYTQDWAIVRTVLVYGKPLFGRDSFINMIAKKLQRNEPFKVVNDQYRTPTYVQDLARGIAVIIRRRATGIFNICGKNLLTPYQMAIKTAEVLGITQHQLQPVTFSEFKEVAVRTLKTGLTIEKARKELGFEPISFEEGLLKTLS